MGKGEWADADDYLRRLESALPFAEIKKIRDEISREREKKRKAKRAWRKSAMQRLTKIQVRIDDRLRKRDALSREIGDLVLEKKRIEGLLED